MAHCTLLKLAFIKGVHKEQKHFCLHQLGGRRPLKYQMHMKITFHSKKPKQVEGKRVGRRAAEKQSSASVHYPFSFDRPPRYPQLDYRKTFPKAKTDADEDTAAPLAPSPARAPRRAGSAPNRAGAEAPSPSPPQPRDFPARSRSSPQRRRAAARRLRARCGRARLRRPRRGSPRSSLLPAASAGERVAEGRPLGLPRPPPALILLLPGSPHGGGSVPGGPRPEGRSGSPAAAAPHRPLRMGCARTHICTYVLYLCVCAYIARICHLTPHRFSPARRGGRCLRGGVQGAPVPLLEAGRRREGTTQGL